MSMARHLGTVVAPVRLWGLRCSFDNIKVQKNLLLRVLEVQTAWGIRDSAAASSFFLFGHVSHAPHRPNICIRCQHAADLQNPLKCFTPSQMEIWGLFNLVPDVWVTFLFLSQLVDGSTWFSCRWRHSLNAEVSHFLQTSRKSRSIFSLLSPISWSGKGIT